MITRKDIRKQQKFLKQENKRFGSMLEPVPSVLWPHYRQSSIKEVWRSANFFVQVFKEADGMERMSVNRTQVDEFGNWVEHIGWDDLQTLKSQIGRGFCDAVEVYPSDADIVNVANMRHLWIMPAPIPWKWKKGKVNMKDEKLPLAGKPGNSPNH